MPKTPLSVQLEIKPDLLKAQAMGQTCEIFGQFETAQNPGKTTAAAHQAFAKTDRAPFYLSDLKIENPQSLFVPVSVLNDLRRRLYQDLELPPKITALPPLPSALKNRKKEFVLKTDSAALLTKLDLTNMAEVIYLLNPETDVGLFKLLPKNKVRLALPTVCRRPKCFAPVVQKLLEQGYRKWEIGHAWGLALLPEKGIDLSFDTPFYMMNTQAFAMAQEMGATRACFAIEDTLENIRQLASKPSIETTFVIYQDVPLFTSAVCLRANSCRECPKDEKWSRLQKGKEQFDVLSKKCGTTVFSAEPLCLASEAASVSADYYRIDFVGKVYSPEKAAYLLDQLSHFKDVPGSRKGNMQRRL